MVDEIVLIGVVCLDDRSSSNGELFQDCCQIIGSLVLCQCGRVVNGGACSITDGWAHGCGIDEMSASMIYIASSLFVVKLYCQSLSPNFMYGGSTTTVLRWPCLLYTSDAADE